MTDLDSDYPDISYDNFNADLDYFVFKVFYNMLKYNNNGYGDGAIAESILEYPGFSGHKVLDNIWKIKNDYEKSRKRGGEKRINHIFFCDYIKSQNINEFRRDILELHPSISGEWQISQNAKVLSSLLDLSKIEEIILCLALKLCDKNASYQLRETFSTFTATGENKEVTTLYSKLLDVSSSEIEPVTEGFLVRSKILILDGKVNGLYCINPEFTKIFVNTKLTHENIADVLFPSNLSTKLNINNYSHLQKEIEITEAIINQGLESKDRGTNIMFWGLPGTGKTELALVLAQKNNWNLRVIGDISEGEDSEKSRAQRLASLKIALKLYANDKSTVLLFDEMEDIFKDDKNEEYSKAFINRIIETTKIPIIWTTNNLTKLGAATLRRMVYNISFQVPPAKARKQIWKNYLDQYNLTLDSDIVDEFALNYDMVPALISNAVKISSLTKCSSDKIPELLTKLDTLVNYGEERKFDQCKPASTPYDASCANTDIDLDVLVQRLIDADSNFSLCLYGPPGTGKSEFGRHLAKKLNKKILFKRASDLQSSYVGECEKNIAHAFNVASEEEMVFIIDEGDSFLRSREGASRSWEVSQVNEMLSQMESHDQPFIITTNMMDELDGAALRRFTFKVRFDFMKPAQVNKLFQSYFGGPAPSSLLKNDILAPGDFANVKKKAKILKITDLNEIAKMLEEECDLKPQKTKKFGF